MYYYNNYMGGYPNGYPSSNYPPQMQMNYSACVTSSDYDAFYAKHDAYEAMGIANQINTYQNQLNQYIQQPGYYVPPQNVANQGNNYGVSTYPFKPYVDTIDKQPMIPFNPTLVKLDEKHERIKKLNKPYYEMNDDEKSEMIKCCSRYKRRHGLASDAFVDYGKALEDEIDFVKGVEFEKVEEKKEEPKPEPIQPQIQPQQYYNPQPMMVQPQPYYQPLPTNPVFQQQPQYSYTPYGSAFGVPRQNQMIQQPQQNVGIHITGSPLDQIKVQAQQYANSAPQYFENIKNTVKMMPYTPGSPSLNQGQLPTNPVFQQQPTVNSNIGYPQYNPYISNRYNYSPAYTMDRAAYDQYYNNQLNNDLYGNVGEFDVEELFRQAILTEGELLRRRANTPIGYYDNGVYRYDEEARAKYKEYMDDQYRKQVELNIRISKACHQDDGVTDEQIRMMYDPIYRNSQTKTNMPITCVGENDMIPDELAAKLKTPIIDKDPTIGQYNRMVQQWNEYNAFASIHNRFMQEIVADYGRDIRKLEAFAKIKESHNKLLGLKPGESVTGWDDFAARSGPLCVEVAKYKSKRYLNKRIRRFDKDNFCTRVDIKTSIDALCHDDAIPLEFQLKNNSGEVLNKVIQGYLFTKEDGIIPMMTPPPGADQSMSPEARAKMELARITAGKNASRDMKDEFIAYAAKGRNV